MRIKPTFGIIALVILLPILLLNASCGLPFLEKPTETPTPTTTATFTPLPTSTNTPRPTAKALPNLFATQAAERNQAIRDILTQLNLSVDTGSVGWYQNEKVDLPMEGNQGFYYKFDPTVIASDFVISTEITWNTNSWPTCGLWFRTDDDWGDGDHYGLYFLRFSGLPAFSIRYYQDGNFSSNITEETRYSSYLSSEDGATNQIILAAVGNEFKVYINGVFEGRYYDWGSKLSKGKFAFRAYQSAGETTCTFDNTWIWIYK
jgi:hypothetical protein